MGDTAPSSERIQRPLSLPEVRIAVFYVMLASSWIIGSDVLLEWLIGGQADTLFYQTFKGLNFVVTTGLLLYLVLRRAFGGWRRSEELRLACLHNSNERFRNLSARIQTLREEERTRISREIHDELGQLLTGAKMQLRIIENRLADRNDRTLNPLIDDLVETEETIDATIDSVRRISSGLRPLALDHLGLTAAMSEEAAQFTRRTGIEAQVHTTEWDTVLPAETETTAFRIFQESLTNVARHSGASHVEAECKVNDGHLSLTIRDNGIGIDIATVNNPASLGLAGMLERATAVGGKVGFSSEPGHGTEVTLIIPLRSPEAPDGLAPNAHENPDC